MLDIAFVLYPGFTPLDVIGPFEVLSRLPDARAVLVAERAGPVVAESGMLTLQAHKAFSDLPSPDVLVVPGGLTGTFAAAEDQHLLRWLRNAHRSTTWTTSVCTGALILGASGILQGRRATTHWAARDQLAQYDAGYTGDRVVVDGNVMTAAGVSAGIDMALRLAAEIAGVDTAHMIQLLMEYAPEPPFTSGSLDTASASTVEATEHLLRAAAVREVESGIIRPLD